MNITAVARTTARQRIIGSEGPRRYLARGLSLARFFALLQQREVPYVVLRWFDSLPQVEAGEDIDILVADEHLDYVRTLLVARPTSRRSQKFDVYTVSGLPGSDFGGVPYYPPTFAREMLRDAVWLRQTYRVPSLQHHLDSLGYHAAYHKGWTSGLQDGAAPGRSRQPSDHDYETVLSKLAAELGTELVVTLAGLDNYLAGKGLQPPLDTLERLEPRNPWIRTHFFDRLPAIDPVFEGLAVFVLRERSRERVEAATTVLDHEGFEVLDVLRLTPYEQTVVADRVRGGNWGRGPWQRSGGLPSVLVVAYDLAPRLSPDDGDRLTNLRIPEAKAALRRSLLEGVAPADLYNPVHSSDNPRQALDYLEVAGGADLVAGVRARVAALLEGCAFPYPILQVLPTYARRARVAVVQHPVHGPTICKVFRPGAARFFARELRARQELSDLPQVPALLEHGQGWLLTPRFADDRRHVRRRLHVQEEVQLQLWAARELAGFARALHSRGLYLLDLASFNMVSDPRAGLKVIDFEFLQEYDGVTPSLDRSYVVSGVPRSACAVDVPRRTMLSERGSASALHPAVTGLQPRALLGRPRVTHRLTAPVVQLGWHGYFLARELYYHSRSGLWASPTGRRLGRLRRALLARRPQKW